MRTERIVPAHGCILALLIVTACAEAGPDLTLGTATLIASPAGPASGEPFLAPGRDGVWMSWIERVDSAHEVRVSRLADGSWSEPSVIAKSDRFFVNWADFPSVFEAPDGRLVAHWLERSGAGRYAYDVVLSMSSDGGATWSTPTRPHADGTETEHGFATLFAMQDGTVGAVWLDGRETAGVGNGHGEPGHPTGMTLRFTTMRADGTVAPDALVDGLTCDCCQTDVAVTSEGPVLVYRDRTAAEIRDIVARRLAGGEWTEAVAVHDDGWEIPGCPVNGPSAVAQGRTVAVAWFTAARDTPRVRLAFSNDAGATFAAPIRIDDGDPIGRVDILLLEDGRALVSWLERTEGSAEVRVRLASPDGSIGPATTVTASSAERASGFPRMTRSGDAIVFAWTEPGQPAQVRLATMPLSSPSSRP